MHNKWMFVAIIALLFLPPSLYARSLCNIEKFPDKQISYCLYSGPKPVIVLESGLGNDMNSWPKDFILKLNRSATILIYNRMGYEGSFYFSTDKNRKTILAKQTAKNLHDLLHKLNINRPLVLVGHSLGGLYMHAFARSYPKQVASVVLIDASSPDENKNTPFKTQSVLQKGSTAYREFRGIYPSDLQIRQLPPFPNIPLLIIVANNHFPPIKRAQFEAMWLKLQKKSLRFSSQSQLIIADGSGHYVFQDQPAVVINAILSSLQLSAELKSGINAGKR
jgi:pimeloyl-ACP methyl ester carboxylesterase